MHVDESSSAELFQRLVAAVEEIANADEHLPVVTDVRLDSRIDGLVWADAPTPPESLRIGSRPFRELDWEPITAVQVDRCRRAAIAILMYRRTVAEVEQREHWQATLDSEFDEVDDADVDGRIRQHVHTGLERLRRYLRELRVADVRDPDLLWELHAAGSAGDPDRLVEVCDQLTARAPSPQHLSTAAKAIFLAHSGLGAGLGPSAWIPDWASTEEQILRPDLIFLHAALDSVSAVSLLLARKPIARTRGAEHPQHLLRMKSYFERLAATTALSQQDVAIRAWAAYNLAAAGMDLDLILAGSQFLDLAGRVTGTSLPVDRALSLAAVGCFLRAQRADLAEGPLKVHAQSTKQPHDLLQLAQCYHLQGKEEDTLATFERYVAGAGDTADDFTTTLALQFGLRARERSDLQGFLATAALNSPTRPQADRLIDWIQPWHANLSEQARDRWSAGLLILATPQNAELLGDHLWTQAAIAFGETVNSELRHRLFRPFLTADSLRALLRQHPVDRHDESYPIIKRRGTLGQHCTLLRRSVRDFKDPLASCLRDWLKQHQPSAYAFLDSPKASQLDEVVALRNKAAHDSVTRAETRRLFELAGRVLDALSR